MFDKILVKKQQPPPASMGGVQQMKQLPVSLNAAEIEFKNMRFLITDRPSEATLDRYIQELNNKKVKEVVRVCAPTYDAEKLQSSGIHVIDCPYEDGQVPPSDVLDSWFSLLKKCFAENPDSCIAVHCVGGLGRSPVLVGLALIELGMKNDQAVELIRMKRRGAMNPKQVEFLERYRPKSRLRMKKQDHVCSIQ